MILYRQEIFPFKLRSPVRDTATMRYRLQAVEFSPFPGIQVQIFTGKMSGVGAHWFSHSEEVHNCALSLFSFLLSSDFLFNFH